jgi:hypothetical protein
MKCLWWRLALDDGLGDVCLRIVSIKQFFYFPIFVPSSYFLPIVMLFLCSLLQTVVGFCVLCYFLVCIFVISCVLFYSMCIAFLHTLVAGLLARNQYPEGPATGHLGTGFSWFRCVWKRMLRWFPRLQVATACFSCGPSNLKFLDPYFIFVIFILYLCAPIITTATGWQPICS